MNSTLFNAGDILETIRMIQDECLDIRTTTMGISLLDCIDPDINKACDKVYDKITRKAEKLVETGEKIEKEYGIPIINKRISVTPIAMIAGAIFGGSAWVSTSAYFIGMAAIICSGIILKKTKIFAGDPAPFVMELPAYHVPAWGNVFRATWERGWSFIKRAGSVILLATVVLWFLQGFGFENGAFGMVEDQDNSVLAAIATKIAWIFAPLGFGNWRATVASVSGLIAKENVVGTFGVLYHFGGELSENGDEIWAAVAQDYTALSAYAFMIFNLLCAPCFAAMGAIKREMNNGKWTAIAIGYMCALAYCAALVVYQIGGLITGEVGFNFFTIVAIVIFAAFLYLMFRPNKYVGDNEVKIDVSKIK